MFHGQRRRVLFECAHHLGRSACHHTVRGHVLEHQGPRSDHRALADDDVPQDGGPCPDKHPLLHLRVPVPGLLARSPKSHALHFNNAQKMSFRPLLLGPLLNLLPKITPRMESTTRRKHLSPFCHCGSFCGCSVIGSNLSHIEGEGERERAPEGDERRKKGRGAGRASAKKSAPLCGSPTFCRAQGSSSHCPLDDPKPGKRQRMDAHAPAAWKPYPRRRLSPQ